MKCEIRGCNRPAHWLVAKPDTTVTTLRGRGVITANEKHVCDKCRDELCAVYGWHFIWNRGEDPGSQPEPDPDPLDDAAVRTRNNLELMLASLPDDDPSYVRQVVLERRL